MGTWDVGPFDNDTAADWCGDLHDAAPAPQPALGGPSVLMLGAGARIGAAVAAIALLWAAVAWALTDLAA